MRDALIQNSSMILPIRITQTIRTQEVEKSQDFGLTDEEIVQRKRILYELEEFIKDTVYEDAELNLFGSSYNGFGLKTSDMDISLTFRSNSSGKKLKFPDIVKQLAEVLQKHNGVCKIQAIPTSKIPIVKFKHERSGLTCDISLYNRLAQRNSNLLETYSRVDPRVKVLGYAFKKFIEACDIGDAARWGLSSYAYILMLIHYLQQCRPPVLPVLQEVWFFIFLESSGHRGFKTIESRITSLMLSFSCKL
ncbi:terminal uridylyltransferase 4-like [Gigantopelta aegis]|uniref:terminal uridylyltransferase 4-like n=1 Tax=Gigantopelta aegis TaxID=1735272 RepID=UPI001B889BB5|nr:terminal uridylyltransferase 4-like [Gigantopelta aegis]